MESYISQAGPSNRKDEEGAIVDHRARSSKLPRFNKSEKSKAICSPASNSTTDGNLLSTSLEKLQLQDKIKKVRRKPRFLKKKDKISNGQTSKEMEQSEDVSSHEYLPFEYKIRAIRKETKSRVFRIKNDGCKHVNLKYNINLNGIKIVKSDKDLGLKNANKNHKFDVQKNFNGIVSFPIKTTDNTTNLQSVNCSYRSASPGLSSSEKKRKRKKRMGKGGKKFPNYWSKKLVEDGLESGQVIKGPIRINAKNSHDAYVSNEDGSQHDYLIQSMLDRNRALEGDVVAICIKPQNEWTEKLKTATVVKIVEQVHPRTAVGFLKSRPETQQYATFIPRDLRVPRMLIRMDTCPPAFAAHPSRFESILFKAKLSNWSDVKCPVGVLLENIGPAGDLESETLAILTENSLDVTPFPEELISALTLTDIITEEDLSYREDLRNECIFTIDPLTARDLDDAVSCKELPNGNLEVGVHISDVSYYLNETTKLDELVRRKATTIYLVNSVYHMLPRELCMHCSLLPGVDKLAFSVFWEMTKTGEIISYRFTRSIINSCAQLAYEHAQMMIEDPKYEFKDNELPQIYGNFTYKDLSRVVNYLQPIAVNFRNQRFENGTLRIDQIKLLFRLDPNTGDPSEMSVYNNQESHRLIEEFMLLANNYVAKKIYYHYPDLAFLRCHSAPNQNMLVDLVKMLKPFNINLDISSSKSIQSTISDLKIIHKLDDAKLLAVYHLIAKPMKRAQYICANNTSGEQDFHHYALNTPMYTHFTSPIRRYADIMVHRLLAASLGYHGKPQWTSSYVSHIASNCNIQKQNAKLAGEASSDLYLAHYVAENQPFIKNAIVIDVKNSFFDILIVETGTIIRMHPNNLDDGLLCREDTTDSSKKKYLIIFPETSTSRQEVLPVELFSPLMVSLNRKPKTNKLEAKLMRPTENKVLQN